MKIGHKTESCTSSEKSSNLPVQNYGFLVCIYVNTCVTKKQIFCAKRVSNTTVEVLSSELISTSFIFANLKCCAEILSENKAHGKMTGTTIIWRKETRLFIFQTTGLTSPLCLVNCAFKWLCLLSIVVKLTGRSKSDV